MKTSSSTTLTEQGIFENKKSQDFAILKQDPLEGRQNYTRRIKCFFFFNVNLTDKLEYTDHWPVCC